ncbi:MAG: dethiobiotin synthase [Myxococcota bacterium]
MSTRIFIVGTDTEVGKTAVTAALLHTATQRGVRAIPFKPAQSGEDTPSDIERLLAAAGLPNDSVDSACPLRYAPPLAPGLADDPTPFRTGNPTPDPTVLHDVSTALDHWEAQHDPALTLVEGAGGLHVPMPGATWQPAWITALCSRTLVVGRAGLGTINHTLATITGLRDLGRPPLGFVLSLTEPRADPSVPDNAMVIAAASGVPHLGTLPHGSEPASTPDLLDALLARLDPPARRQ